MGMSVYYTAKREHPLDDAEKAAVQSIVDKYCAAFPFHYKHQDFCLYAEPFDEPDTVLDGATSIPMVMKAFYEIILHWLSCLTELTGLLPDCAWSAHLDDVDLIWEKENGWRLPTDEEMKERRSAE